MEKAATFVSVACTGWRIADGAVSEPDHHAGVWSIGRHGVLP